MKQQQEAEQEQEQDRLGSPPIAAERHATHAQGGKGHDLSSGLASRRVEIREAAGSRQLGGGMDLTTRN